VRCARAAYGSRKTATAWSCRRAEDSATCWWEATEGFYFTDHYKITRCADRLSKAKRATVDRPGCEMACAGVESWTGLTAAHNGGGDLRLPNGSIVIHEHQQLSRSALRIRSMKPLRELFGGIADAWIVSGCWCRPMECAEARPGRLWHRRQRHSISIPNIMAGRGRRDRKLADSLQRTGENECGTRRASISGIRRNTACLPALTIIDPKA